MSQREEIQKCNWRDEKTGKICGKRVVTVRIKMKNGKIFKYTDDYCALHRRMRNSAAIRGSKLI